MFGTYQLPLQKGVDVFPGIYRSPAIVRTLIMDRLGIWEDYRQDLIDAGNRIIQNHLGQITSFFQGQRQNFSLSIAPSSRTRLSLPQLEIEYYCMPGGQEQLTITVDPANELTKKLEQDTLYLLVFSEGNRVSAIPMTNLRGKPIYAATLKHSSWGASPLRAAQMKGARGFSVVMSPLSVTNNRVQVETTYQFGLAGREDALQKFKSTNVGTDKLYDEYRYPIMNGTGNTYYSALTKLEVTSAGLTVTSEDPGGGYTPLPYAISPSGDRYHGFVAMCHVGPSAKIYAFSTYLAPAPNVEYSAKFDGTFYALFNYYSTNTTLVWNDALMKDEIVYVTMPVVGPKPFSRTSYDGSLNSTIPWMVHDQSEGLGKLKTDGHQVYNRLDYMKDNVPTTYYPDRFDHSINFLEINVTKHKEDNGYIAGLVPFPHSSPGGKNFSSTREYSGEFSEWSTPYGSFSGTDFSGWMDLTNGQHLIQGFIVDDVTHLYLDGEEYAPKVRGDIQMILMDIPLLRIKQLT